MYQYRQIIIQLRLGDSFRSIARTRNADCKTIKRIQIVAEQQGWLNPGLELPDDAVLAQFLDSKQVPSQLQKLLPYKTLVETWHRQGVQASIIHAALERAITNIDVLRCKIIWLFGVTACHIYGLQPELAEL